MPGSIEKISKTKYNLKVLDSDLEVTGGLPKFLFVFSGAVTPCKGSSERTRRSRAFPHGCVQASGRGGNLGRICLGKESQPALGSAGSGSEWGYITGRPG